MSHAPTGQREGKNSNKSHTPSPSRPPPEASKQRTEFTFQPQNEQQRTPPPTPAHKRYKRPSSAPPRQRPAQALVLRSQTEQPSKQPPTARTKPRDLPALFVIRRRRRTDAAEAKLARPGSSQPATPSPDRKNREQADSPGAVTKTSKNRPVDSSTFT